MKISEITPDMIDKSQTLRDNAARISNLPRAKQTKELEKILPLVLLEIGSKKVQLTRVVSGTPGEMVRIVDRLLKGHPHIEKVSQRTEMMAKRRFRPQQEKSTFVLRGEENDILRFDDKLNLFIESF